MTTSELNTLSYALEARLKHQGIELLHVLIQSHRASLPTGNCGLREGRYERNVDGGLCAGGVMWRKPVSSSH